ncbi:toll-like receptor 2 [Saccostrea cucullata]|uniref:toll-like receptor 2 n=1 Tax=Saccostrea cuccullata TaxID=36930 RepID=UPI002ECFE40A
MSDHSLFTVSNLVIFLNPCPTVPYTDECGNFGILWNCSGLNTDRLPENIPQELINRNVALDLSFNNFSTLTEQLFENLAAVSVVTSIILSHNKITKIENKTFHRLSGLCSLDLSSCELDKKGIEVEAFSYIHNLKYLRIDQNNFQADGYPDVALSAIQSLSSLHIDIFSGFSFTAPFENLTNLSELQFHIVNDFSLTNTSFLGLRRSKIHDLIMYFKNHVFCDVTEDLFCSFPYLTENVTIDFGGKCDITPALRSLKCFQHHDIGKIFMDQNTKDLETGIIVLDDWLSEYLINVCVRSLSLGQNGINSININIYYTTLWNCLQYLDLSRNHLHVVDLSIVLSLLSAPNIKNMHLCCNNPRTTENQLNIYHYDRSIFFINITLSKNLEVLDISKNYFHSSPSLKLIGERLQKLYIQETNFPLAYVDQFDLPSLKTLDISGNSFKKVHSDLFQHSRGIENLNAIGMNLDFTEKSNLKDLFRNLENLSSIDFSRNKLNFLPSSLLKDQHHSLTKINLDNNKFSNIPDTFKYMQNLISLHLRYNLMSGFSNDDQRIIETLENISIYIEGNPISCTCSAIQSLRWMRSHKHVFSDINKTLCTGNRVPISHLFYNEQIWRKFDKECQTKQWLIFSVVLILITLSVLLIVAALRRYRIHVEYVILRLRNRWKGVHLQNKENNYIYDVFVSYGEKDYPWIMRYLYPKLESLNIKVWLKDRDSIPGDWEAEEIVKCINESRKVLFVITECFLESGWASYAVQMAVTHAFHNRRQSSIVVIIKDDIPLERLPNDIKNIWWCIEYLRWPTEHENNDLIIVKLSNLLKPVDA